MSIIRIKRSGTSGAPSTLATGELAYSWYDAGDSNQTSGGLRLYAGTGVDANTGLAASIDVIGGEYFTTKLDHTPGVLVANSAIITAANNAIDQLLIDTIHIDGSTIGINANTTYAAANTNLTITAGSTGSIILASNTIFSGVVDFDDQVTVASLNVEDLTATRVTYAGTNGELVDDAGFTYTGSGANGTLTVAGTLDVNTEALLATAKVEDLTDNRIVIVGTGGELEDDANFTFNGTEFNLGQGNFTVQQASGNLYVAGTVDVDGDTRIGANGASNFTVAAADGATEIQGTLTVRSDVDVGANNQFTVASASGNVQTKGTLDVDGQATLASLNVEDLTSGRVTFAGTNGELEDNANFVFTTGNNTLSVTGTQIITGDLQVDNITVDGNTISSTDTDGNITLDPDGDGYVQVAGTNGLVIPVGNTAQQGPNVAGSIRYNSEINQFEGYSGVNWSSMGGVRSVDGLTYIIAESSPGASDDIIYFYTATSNTATNIAAELDDVSLRLVNGTASSNTTSGTLVVTGGAGISGDVNIGGSVDIDTDLNVDGGDITTNATTFNLINTNATTVNAFGAATAVNIGTGGEGGGLTTIGHDLKVSGDFTVGANAFFVDHATGDALVGRDLTVTGDLTVNGNTTTINVSTLEVEDALIYLAANNTTSDSVDIGFAGNFFDASANTTMITGLFRDSGTKQWYLFDEYQDPDIDDNNIDISSNTFSKGVLNTDRVNFSNTTIQLTGDVAGDVTIDHVGGGDGLSNTVITIATTVQADSVALGTDTTGDYVATIAEGASVDPVTAGSNNQIAVHITGTGEGAAVTVAAVLANTNGQLGVATYDATNFDVSNTGVVTVDTIDGGTY